ncbi:tetratricopeptide repeat protein [Bacteroidota bacterium]
MKYFIKILFVFIFISYYNIHAQAESESLKRRALAHMQAGRYGEAIDQLHKFVSANPRIAEGYNLRGLCYEKRKEYQYSVLDFRRAHKLDPKDPEIKKNLDRVIAIWHELLYEKIEGHEREIAIDPSLPFNYLEIGKSYRWLEIWHLAEEWYDQYLARDDNASPDEIIRYTEILAKTGSIKKGEIILKKFVDRYPEDWRLWSRYGYFSIWLGKYRNAKKAFETALSFKPFFKEAQDGLDLAKRKGYLTRYIPRAFERVYPIDEYYSVLKRDPYNDKTRFRLVEELIKERRIEEASEQLEILSRENSESERYRNLALTVDSIRTNVFENLVEEYSATVKENPSDKKAVMQLADSYGKLYAYDESLEILEEYLQNIPDDQDLDVRFQYARYAAWNYEWERSIEQLDKLLEINPDNLDYQLLRGQISVWTVLDLDQGQSYLENVLTHRPKDINAMLALASLHAWRKEFPIAKEYIDRAKAIDPVNVEVENAESNYFLHLSAAEELEILKIRGIAGELAQAGLCEEALAKYDEYLSKITGPTRQELKEYADISTCAEKFDDAIRIYDQLLNDEYEYDIALKRAKTYLWSDDSLNAVSELERLYEEDPENYETKLFLGQAYSKIGKFDEAQDFFEELMDDSEDPEQTQILSDNIFATKLFIADSYAAIKDYGEAEDIYNDLLDQTTDTTKINMLNQRLDWIPPYGISAGIKGFFDFILPDNIGLAPQFTYYRDNQKFEFYNWGGRFEMGFTGFLSLGGSFQRTKINSKYFSDSKYLTSFKGHASIRFSQFIVTDIGYGKLTTPGEPQKDIYSFVFRYDKEDKISLHGFYDHSDARVILYSPNLLPYSYNVDIYRISGSYQPNKHLTVSGYYSYLDISDGNKGNDLQLRVGRKFIKIATIGYEYFYSTYKYDSPIYYSPQNFESHSIWGEWDAYENDESKLVIGGKIGYYPAIDFVINEIHGDFNYRALKYLHLNARLAAGTTHRFDTSYNFVSAMLSAYWSIF